MEQQIIKTDIYWRNAESFGKVSILKETEKAILVVYTQTVRRGTSSAFVGVEREQWIPKSVWNNDKNFEEHKFRGEGDLIKCFIPPYFLTK